MIPRSIRNDRSQRAIPFGSTLSFADASPEENGHGVKSIYFLSF